MSLVELAAPNEMGFRHAIKLDPAYHDREIKVKEVAQHKYEEVNKQYQEGVTIANETNQYNSLHPFKRFLHNTLGPRAGMIKRGDR